MARKSYRRKAAEAEHAAAGTGGARPDAVDPNVALFAAWVREEEAREKAEKRAARAERRRAEEHQRLIDAKEAAAAELKRLRRQGGGGADRVAQADAAYRAALAALLTHETGQAPAWAPTVDEPAGEVADAGPTAIDEPSADDSSTDESPSPTLDDEAASD